MLHSYTRLCLTYALVFKLYVFFIVASVKIVSEDSGSIYLLIVKNETTHWDLCRMVYVKTSCQPNATLHSARTSYFSYNSQEP